MAKLLAHYKNGNYDVILLEDGTKIRYNKLDNLNPSFAESIGAEIIIVGWDAEEAATFPDNSKEFMDAFNELISIGSPENIKIEAPAIDLNKEEIVKLGVASR